MTIYRTFQDGDVFSGVIANNFMDIWTNFQNISLNAGTTNASTVYTAARMQHAIANIGTVNAYVNFGSPATTSNLLVEPLTTRIVEGSASTVSVITSAGTTVIRILGVS